MIQRALATRDPVAIRRVVDQLTPIIQAAVVRGMLRRRWAARSRAIRQEVEDLTQEVFASLLVCGGRRLLAWSPDRGSAHTYFGLIAERLVLNRLCSRRLSPWTEDASEPAVLEETIGDGFELEQRLDSREKLRVLGDRLLEGLNARDARLFELIYIEEQDVETICETLGIDRNTLYQARFRLKRRVKELARDLLEVEDGAKVERSKS